MTVTAIDDHAPASTCPLVVDMDGTLLRADTLHEGCLTLIRQRPLRGMLLLGSLLKGKAAFKQQVAARALLDVASLPVNAPFLAWLREQKAAGRKIVLCTAADQRIADAVAAHLGIFNEVIASDGNSNLKGRAKAACLIERYGEHGFDYAGNDHPDIEIFRHARKAIVVNAPAKVTARALALSNAKVFAEHSANRSGELKRWLKLLRIHQWKKNILLLAAPVAGHLILDVNLWPGLMLAFLAFSLAASCVYIINDLMDLDNDRHHLSKRQRPLASGQISILQGIALIPLIALASLGFAFWAGSSAFGAWLLVYFLITSAYSLWLKKIILLDCMVLAILYVLRVIAGAAVVGAAFSSWLLAFSLFLFLSLAFVKRYAELELKTNDAAPKTIKGRGYRTGDITLVQTMGVASGFMSVLVLALYLNSPEVHILYRTPHMLWLTIPVMLYWICYVWMQAHRGHMHDDPVVFATRNPVSLACGVVFVGVLLLAGLMT